jgi:hypothetical protein
MYGWLAIRFDRLWMVYLGIFAAPMLLLRSRASVETGVQMLTRYAKEEAGPFSSSTPIYLLSAFASGMVAYRLSSSLSADGGTPAGRGP